MGAASWGLKKGNSEPLLKGGKVRAFAETHGPFDGATRGRRGRLPLCDTKLVRLVPIALKAALIALLTLTSSALWGR
jgi:sugar lactone lactonase YvrE